MQGASIVHNISIKACCECTSLGAQIFRMVAFNVHHLHSKLYWFILSILKDSLLQY
jgi:hypothetical protein